MVAEARLELASSDNESDKETSPLLRNINRTHFSYVALPIELLPHWWGKQDSNLQHTAPIAFESFAVSVLNLYIYYIRNFKKSQIFLVRVVWLEHTATSSQN